MSKYKKWFDKVMPIHKIILSFVLVIFIGSLLLCFPFMNNGEPTSYLNNLFIATSATCVTGLVPVTTAVQYSLAGQIVIILLIQIGGLGFLTFAYLFLLLINKRLTLNDRILLQEALNFENFKGLMHYLMVVIKFTFSVEGIGAILLMIRFIPKFGFLKGFYYGIFHSISAFCNAGFDVLGTNSLCDYATDPLVNFVICGLIIAGGLGFIVWISINRTLRKWYHNLGKCASRKWGDTLGLQARLVLIMTIFLLLSGAIIFLLLEWNNPGTIGNYGFFDKCLVSFFSSTTYRTAGFATIDFAKCTTAAKMIGCIYMLIGGSPAGTAGGIKTMVAALIFLKLRSMYRGYDSTRCYNKKISDSVVMNAFAIITIFLAAAFGAIFILSITEQLPFIDLTFEVFSAIATVGLTAGVTPYLTSIGKIVIIILMFMGRIGPLSVVMAMTTSKKKKSKNINYPEEKILLG